MASQASLAGTCALASNPGLSAQPSGVVRGSSNDGAVAQLGERLICIQEVAGSIPTSSTSFKKEVGRQESECEGWPAALGGSQPRAASRKDGPVAQLARAHP